MSSNSHGPSLPGLTHPGTLALAGSGEYLPPMRSVDEYLLGRVQGTPRVVCLPTAAGMEGHRRIQYWCRLGEQHFAGLGVPAQAVPVIDRVSAEDPANAGRIQQASFVYLSGGNPFYLYKTLHGTPAWAAIWSVLERGGVLAGCSAGAMIMGERLPLFPIPGVGRKAFGLLPGTLIVPHFDEIPGSFVKAVKALVKRQVLVGIDGNTALVSADGQLQVMGTGRVAIWGEEGRKDFYQDDRDSQGV